MHTVKKMSIQKTPSNERTALLIVRLITVLLLVVLLVTHVRSVRVFRWEQSVSGGVLVTYLMAAIGLALCVSTDRCGGKTFPAYICSTGATFLSANAAGILSRWHWASALTRAMAEILHAVGVPLRTQIYMKVGLSIAAAMCFLADLILDAIITN